MRNSGSSCRKPDGWGTRQPPAWPLGERPLRAQWRGAWRGGGGSAGLTATHFLYGCAPCTSPLDTHATSPETTSRVPGRRCCMGVRPGRRTVAPPRARPSRGCRCWRRRGVPTPRHPAARRTVTRLRDTGRLAGTAGRLAARAARRPLPHTAIQTSWGDTRARTAEALLSSDRSRRIGWYVAGPTGWGGHRGSKTGAQRPLHQRAQHTQAGTHSSPCDATWDTCGRQRLAIAVVVAVSPAATQGPLSSSNSDP